MDRVITVTSAATGATADVRVAAHGTTVADVLPTLLRLTSSEHGAVTRAGAEVDPRVPIAHLRDGDSLVIGAARLPDHVCALRLEVIAGPDAGRALALVPGRHVLGRDTEPLRGTDPLVSRRHIEVVVSEDGQLTVADLHAQNGSRMEDEELVPSLATTWPRGARLRIGDTVLTHGRDATAATVVPTAAGITMVNRAPRLSPTTCRAKVAFPPPPAPTHVARISLLASAAPLLAGGVLALVIRRWEFLAFALMSPVVVVAQWASDRWRARQADRRARAEHARATAAAQRSLAEAVAAEAAHRHARAPDLGSVVNAAVDRTSLLWHRGIDDDDALMLRIGTGTTPASVEIDGDHPLPVLHEVPICLDLRQARIVGICGPDHLTTPLARSLVLQAVTLVGPGGLRANVLAPGRGSQWAWCRWLPHLRSPSQSLGTPATSSSEIRAALDELRSSHTKGRRLVVVDNVGDAAIADTLAQCPDTSVLWLASAESALPAMCDAVVSVSGSPTRAVVRGGDRDTDDVVPDLVDVEVAESVARALCPLRDTVSVASSLPSEVAWSALHDLRLHDDQDACAAALLRRWRGGPTTAVCLGVTAEAPYVVDLQRDGPHMLIAGTTGSGKSELLQTLVASLIAGNSPADLSLLLVDYKGGAAFGPCATAPHTVGVLTDLDAATTTRAIESLSAELRRRERVLADAGVPDLDVWRGRRTAGDEQMPRLVIVVDEFATLAEELPDFVGGLVGIAQRGRSLGVHLVLATQRPEGAVSADIRANVRLRVCLAVAREAESRDVIDGPEALAISRRNPGRALVRLGSSDLIEMQTARVSGPATNSERPLVQVVSGLARDGAAVPNITGPTELDALVAAATHAAGLLGARIATPPWLPPLPTHVGLSDLGLLPGEDARVAIGLLDLPTSQCQPPLFLDTDSNHPLLIVGGARSGRTTATLTVATALAAATPPDRMHLWAIDSGRGLAPLADLPHTGAVVDVHDAERLERLMSFLTAEVHRRRAGSRSAPALLLLVDGWDGLAHATGDVDAGRCQDQLLRLVSDGPSAGLRVVMTTDRGGLTGRVASLFGERICLRLADRTDYALLGVAARQVPGDLPPGRGLRTSGSEVHVVQLAQADADTVAAATAWPAPVDVPRRFDPLPARVPLHALARPADNHLVVGLRGDDLTPARVDPAETGGSLLVAGPPRSGRSTALVSIASQLTGRPVLAVCARPSPLHRRRDLATLLDAGDADKVRAALEAAPDAALLVDDVDLLDDSGVLDVIERAVRSARDGRGFVVLTGATDAMSAAFRGPVAQARRARTGVLLRPEGPHDGDLFGLRLRRRQTSADPPGRGLLAMHGHALPVQLADPD